jgi:hypothetical protein
LSVIQPIILVPVDTPDIKENMIFSKQLTSINPEMLDKERLLVFQM